MRCGCCGETTPTAPCVACGAEPRLDGRYRLEEVLGSGAHGTTWRAVREADDATVVVKELPLAEADARSRELFEREARVLRELDHPGVPRLIEHFIAGAARHRSLCVVQAYVPGRTLAEEGRLGEDAVADVLLGLLPTLAWLHELSPPVVHRDVKPRNVIRTPEGRLVLVDFGAVRDVVDDPALGGATVAGTFGYMAPEQIAGDADPRSDLYALGATAVALLTGREPKTMLGADRRLHWADQVDVSPGLRDVLEDLLAPDPADRPPNARDALARVRALREGRPLPRRKVGWAWPVGVLGLGLVVLFGWTWARQAPAIGRPLVAHGGPEPAPGVEPTTYNGRVNGDVIIPALDDLSACLRMAPPLRDNTVRVVLRLRPDGSVHSSSVTPVRPNLVVNRCVWAWLDDLTFPPPGAERPEVWFNLDVGGVLR